VEFIRFQFPDYPFHCRRWVKAHDESVVPIVDGQKAGKIALEILLDNHPVHLLGDSSTNGISG
jgi:hypothetical protein